jgi:hypothetical protein
MTGCLILHPRVGVSNLYLAALGRMEGPRQSQVLPNAVAGVLGRRLVKEQEVPEILKRTFDRSSFKSHGMMINSKSKIPKRFQLPHGIEDR